MLSLKAKYKALFCTKKVQKLFILFLVNPFYTNVIYCIELVRKRFVSTCNYYENKKRMRISFKNFFQKI